MALTLTRSLAKTRMREKLHSKLDGGSLFTPEAVARGHEVFKELQPHLNILRESAQLTAGSQLQAVASEKLDHGMRVAGERVRESLCEDEHMPGVARAWVHRLIDVLWPEVHREMHSSIMVELGEKLDQYDEPWQEDDEPLVQWHDSPLRYLRGRLLYNVYPYDQSLWQCLRNPKWCAAFALSVWPLYGLQPLYWMVIFVCIERTDEYQLVNFILEFKALMFFSIGFVCLGIGASLNHVCVTWSSQEHFCDKFGPGTSRSFEWEISCFVVQMCNVWLAFLYLPFSNNSAGEPLAKLKGKSSTRSAETSVHAGSGQPLQRAPQGCFVKCIDCLHPGGDYSRGGQLWPWMLYDLLCAGACAACALVSLVWHGFGTPRFQQEKWQFRATLWWCKTAYGLLSLPFVVFLLPGLGSALTHVKATGYNKNGRCVRMLTPTQRRQQREAREAKERMQQYEQEEALGLAPLLVIDAEGGSGGSGGLGGKLGELGDWLGRRVALGEEAEELSAVGAGLRDARRAEHNEMAHGWGGEAEVSQAELRRIESVRLARQRETRRKEKQVHSLELDPKQALGHIGSALLGKMHRAALVAREHQSTQRAQRAEAARALPSPGGQPAVASEEGGQQWRQCGGYSHRRPTPVFVGGGEGGAHPCPVAESYAGRRARENRERRELLASSGLMPAGLQGCYCGRPGPLCYGGDFGGGAYVPWQHRASSPGARSQSAPTASRFEEATRWPPPLSHPSARTAVAAGSCSRLLQLAQSPPPTASLRASSQSPPHSSLSSPRSSPLSPPRSAPPLRSAPGSSSQQRHLVAWAADAEERASR